MNIPRRLAAILVAAWSAVATVILGAAVYLLLTGQVHAQTTRADIEREIASSLASDERCVERNPLLGSHPSTGALIGAKVLAIGLEYWLYSSPRFRHAPTHYYGYTSALIHGAVAASNLRNDCY